MREGTAMRKRLKDSLWLQLIAFTALIMFFLLAAYAVTDSYSGKILRERTIDLNDKILLQVEGKMEDFHDTLDHVATAMAYAPTTYDYFTIDPVARVMASEDLSEIFSNTVLLESDIAGIYLYDTSLNQIAAMGKAANNPDFVRNLKKHMEFGDLFYLNQAGVPFYPVYFPVYDLNNRQYGVQIGMCVMMMRTDNLAGLLEDSQATEHTQVYLLDGNDQIIASRGNNELEELDSSMMRSSDEYYVKVRNVPMDSWKVVSRIPESEMSTSRDGSKKFVTTAYAVSLALLVLLVWFCYKRFVGPMHQVDRFIQGIVDKPGERMEIEREDEIGTVVHSLNHMLDKQQKMNQEIQDSQKKMYEAEIAKKQLQVLAYQNQINPHFLYNALDTINWMAHKEGKDDICDMITAVSSLLRISISNKEAVFTVEKELRYVKDYLYIQKTRYRDRFEVIFDIEPEIYGQLIPKLTIQPLVENAIVHSVEVSREKAELTVEGHREGETVFIRVSDTGVGMTEETRKALLAEPGGADRQDINTAHTGLGVYAVHQRLKYLFGEGYGLTIQSSPGKGTCITIRIPFQMSTDEVYARAENLVERGPEDGFESSDS